MEDLQKSLLQRLAEDDKLLEIIQIELLNTLDDSPNLSLNNEDLGAETRAVAIARNMVQEGIKNIKKFKINQKVGNQDLNPGR